MLFSKDLPGTACGATAEAPDAHSNEDKPPKAQQFVQRASVVAVHRDARTAAGWAPWSAAPPVRARANDDGGAVHVNAFDDEGGVTQDKANQIS
jgi:hypothetical protein